MLTAEKVIELLDLKPLDMEGGYYRETYRSEEAVDAACLPERYTAPKCFSTCIYYLLTPDTVSGLHIVPSDEIFHFYLGDPVTMLRLYPDGRSETIAIGPDIEAGQSVQVIAPRGVWQGSFLQEGGRFALMGCTVAPGFDFPDYVPGKRAELTAQFPQHRELIKRLTAEDARP